MFSSKWHLGLSFFLRLLCFLLSDSGSLTFESSYWLLRMISSSHPFVLLVASKRYSRTLTNSFCKETSSFKSYGVTSLCRIRGAALFSPNNEMKYSSYVNSPVGTESEKSPACWPFASIVIRETERVVRRSHFGYALPCSLTIQE